MTTEATQQQMDVDHTPEMSQEQAGAEASLSNVVVPDSQLNPETYRFPSERLRRRQTQADKIPLVLVACGSFRLVAVSFYPRA